MSFGIVFSQVVNKEKQYYTTSLKNSLSVVVEVGVVVVVVYCVVHTQVLIPHGLITTH